MIFLCFLLILSAFLMYLSLLYLVDVSQMAIFVETEVIILLFIQGQAVSENAKETHFNLEKVMSELL